MLPFENLSPDPDNAYFAAGIHESIISKLAGLRSLNVIARTSVMQYAESAPPIPEIARDLRVETVLEGSVRYAADKVLVTAQLIDGVTGFHLWAAEYPGDLSDVFAIQADIAMNIANALEAEFSLAEQEIIEQVPTEFTAAYAYYLRAMSRTDIVETIADLDQATRLDPEFALAYAQKANFQAISLLGFGEATPAQAAEFERAAQDNAQQALALDSTLGLAYAALAITHVANRRGVAAREAFERALQFSPNDASLLTEYARLKRYTGEYAEAVELMRRAVELDPNNSNPYLNLGVAYRYARQYRLAAAALQNGLELDPTSITIHINLARAEVALGNHSEALRLLVLVEALSGENRPNSLPALASSLGVLGIEWQLVARAKAKRHSR